MKFIILMVTAVVALVVYARFTSVMPKPLDAPENITSDQDLTGGFTAVRPFTGNAATLTKRITDIVLATPRTRKLSDDPLQFVMRSRVVGFPDVTTVQVRDGVLLIHAHLVIGKSDLGVNKARVLDWLDRLGPL